MESSFDMPVMIDPEQRKGQTSNIFSKQRNTSMRRDSASKEEEKALR